MRRAARPVGCGMIRRYRPTSAKPRSAWSAPLQRRHWEKSSAPTPPGHTWRKAVGSRTYASERAAVPRSPVAKHWRDGVAGSAASEVQRQLESNGVYEVAPPGAYPIAGTGGIEGRIGWRASGAGSRACRSLRFVPEISLCAPRGLRPGRVMKSGLSRSQSVRGCYRWEAAARREVLTRSGASAMFRRNPLVASRGSVPS